MLGVVDVAVAGISENWLSESIELSLGLLHVVFNTVSIFINNLSWLIRALLSGL